MKADRRGAVIVISGSQSTSGPIGVGVRLIDKIIRQTRPVKHPSLDPHPFCIRATYAGVMAAEEALPIVSQILETDRG